MTIKHTHCLFHSSIKYISNFNFSSIATNKFVSSIAINMTTMTATLKHNCVACALSYLYYYFQLLSREEKREEKKTTRKRINDAFRILCLINKCAAGRRCSACESLIKGNINVWRYGCTTHSSRADIVCSREYLNIFNGNLMCLST